MAQVRQDNVQIKLEIDGSQSRTELDNLTRKADVLKESMKGLKKGSEDYVNANKELSTVNTRMKELREEIGLTSLTSGQLKAMSAQLNRELQQLTPNTASFLNKAQELANVDARLAQVRLEAKGVKDELNNAGGGVMDFIKKAAGFAGIQLGVQAVVSGLKQLGSESIDAAVKGSDSIADMEKALNLTTVEAKALRGQLEGIDTRTSEENLEGIAVAAGQLGIAKDQAVAFTTAVDQAVVALGDEFSGGVEQVAKELGGLQKLFKQTADLSPAESITKIGSAVNALGAAGIATGPVIADFAARIGQLGDLSPQITQTLGLGAAFQELHLTAEIASGGLTNVLQTAANDTDGFGKQIGLTGKEFKKLLDSDPNEVILRLADSFKGASGTDIIQTLKGLGVTSQEATKVVSLLANKTDLVREKQALASAEFAKGTSLLDEYLKKNTNAAAEVAKAEKSFAQFRQELGEMLIPVYLKFLQYSGLLLSSLRSLPAFVGENKTAFGLLALAVLAFNAEQIKAQATTLRTLALQKLEALGILMQVEGKYVLATATRLQAAATEEGTVAQTGFNAALAANPIGIVITLLALFAFGLKQLYDRSESFRAAVDSLFVMLRPLGALLGSLGGAVGELVGQLGHLFGSFSSGKGALEVFGSAVAVSVVLPLKLLVAGVQTAVDALLLMVDTGKRVANFFGADFKIDNTALDNFTSNAKANAKSILDTLTGQDGATAAAAKAAQGKRFDDYAAELTRKHSLQVEANAKARALEQKAHADKKADAEKLDEESLKARLANIKAALALVAAGSAEELRLKKLEVATNRDIALLDEKKTAGDKKVIRAEALRDLRQLQDDFDKKSQADAEKRAKEEADVAKKIADLKAGLLTDETAKKILQLEAAAEKEKATAKGTAEQIAQQRKLVEEKLAVDVAELRRARAQKDAQDELDIEKQRNTLIVDAFERRAAELRTAAASESLKVLDTDTRVAEKRRIIQQRLEADLFDLEKDRIEQQTAIAQRIEDIDRDIALRRVQKKKAEAGEFTKAGQDAAQEELSIKKAQLSDDLEATLANENLTINEKLALIRKFHADVKDLEDEAKAAHELTEKEKIAITVDLFGQAVDTLASIQKAGTDKELTKLDKDKKARLTKLDAEYKAGTISKEAYEAQKSTIESNYDAKTRAIKKEAAEKEKQNNVAQAIIATALSVIKASPNPFLMAAAGITGALGVAKIIATPIPEFAMGGVVGGAKPTWREKVRRFASGGINPVAGVPSVGQLHGGGGIRMVDGATGEHLGEWERGEPYMILSRDTYANNRELVDDLLDTSINRGGAPVRRRDGGYYEEGGTPGGSLPAAGNRNYSSNSDIIQALERVEDAVRALPSRQHIGWDEDDTHEIEERLDLRAVIRNQSAIR